MKKIITALLIMVFITSCKSDDDGTSNTDINPIVSTWKLLKSEQNGFAGVNEVSYEDKNVTFEFTDNKIVTVTGENLVLSPGKYGYEIKTMPSGDSEEEFVIIEDVNYEYSLEKNTLILDSFSTGGHKLYFEKK